MTNFNTISTRLWTVPARSPKSSRIAKALVGAVKIYQRLTVGRIAPCRFYPSCSHYAAEAIEVHGAWRGGAMALRRLGRCRPLGPHGIDLVPEAKKVRSIQL
jgi:putative membrane protein insertion efficiency factor